MTTERGIKLSTVDTEPEKMNEQKHIVMMKVNMQKMKKKKNQKMIEEKNKRKEMRNHIQKMMNPYTTLQLKKKKKKNMKK